MNIQELIDYIESRAIPIFTIREDFTLASGEVVPHNEVIYVSPDLFAKMEEETAYANN
jgi:hypothetical protein